MKRILALAAACLLLAACTTTNVKSAAGAAATKPAPGARILVVEPDIQLHLLTASGVQEPRADWTTAGRDNLQAAIEEALEGRSHGFKRLDPDDAMAGRNGQLLRLHGAVGNSILLFQYGFIPLPTKSGSFDWTLGEGAKTLGETYQADYALFVYGRGSYSSGARVAMMVGMAALGVGIPLGGQQAFASLVDLKTGQVVWFNLAQASPSADMRSPEGAAELTKGLLKDIPL
ncbi:hypothetical protein [Caulobacter mirabilis]|uniref:hypothetical protein n=1 Tax=Caulobacter mirabilis TaxID=69666 RepID=UPI001559DC83|nr:hypothetical protein [Caulobacter mirabilis]